MSCNTCGNPPKSTWSNVVATAAANTLVACWAMLADVSVYAISTTLEVPRPVTTTALATPAGSRGSLASDSALATTSRLVATAWTWLTTAAASACALGVAAAATIRACAV